MYTWSFFLLTGQIFANLIFAVWKKLNGFCIVNIKSMLVKNSVLLTAAITSRISGDNKIAAMNTIDVETWHVI